MTDKQILAPTVWLPKKQGQGVLIQDGYILTAAHNIEWSGGSEMASCNEFWEPVETRTRAKFAAKAVFVDLVSDVAVLCGSDDEDGYDKFISEVRPVCLSKSEAELSHYFPVRILTHKSRWVTGTAQFGGVDRKQLIIHCKSHVRAGTSGGPVVDQEGNLLGVVSFSIFELPTNVAKLGERGFRSYDNNRKGPCDVSVAFARRAMPVWLLDRLAKH